MQKNGSGEIRNVSVTRYLSPLREGGSLPAIAEADDGFLYVLKFRGAGQGVKALVAELIGGTLAKMLNLKVPEIVFAQMDESFGRLEPDEEIQDLLKASTGLNLAMHYLQSAITFDPAVNKPDGRLASAIVWLDAFIMNVDRTAKNTNMLMWKNELWLIDHGAALYFHHNWESLETHIHSGFPQIKDHVLLPFADALLEVDAAFKQLLNENDFQQLVRLIPDGWLQNDSYEVKGSEARDGYFRFLWQRYQHSDKFLKAAIDARKAVL